MPKQTPVEQLHIIVYGDPIEGFHFIGPFQTREMAFAAINKPALAEFDCYVAPLEEI